MNASESHTVSRQEVDASSDDGPGESSSDKPPQRPSAAANVAVDCRADTPQYDPFTGDIASNLTLIIHAANVAVADVSVLLVGDERMCELHAIHLDDPTTTDVLTFDLRDRSDIAGPLSVDGDLVLCVDEAARQADARGHDVARELLLYAVHGLLHLLGHDDHDPDEAAAMHVREDELLQAIGHEPVYARALRTQASAE